MSDTFVIHDFAIAAVDLPPDVGSKPVAPNPDAPVRSRGGRPRLSPDAPQTGAERAKRHRQRKKVEAAEANIPVPISDNPNEWEDYLEKVGLAMSRGEFLEDAPRGAGRLVSGGYDSEKIGRVTVRNENAERGKRKTPSGAGADTVLRNETHKKKRT